VEQLLVLLPIMGFIALAAGLAVVFRGTGRIAARTRELQHFKGAVKDMAVRADALLGAAASQIDAVRHQQAGPEAINQTVTDATDALERYGDEARAWSGPRPRRFLPRSRIRSARPHAASPRSDRSAGR